MTENEYLIDLLSDEIPPKIDSQLPDHWKAHKENQIIKHLILWRHHLEGQYKATVKNHNVINQKIDQYKGQNGTHSKPLGNELIELNRQLQNDHNTLREIENLLNQQISEIIKEENQKKDKISTKLLSIFAVLISLGALLFDFYDDTNIQDIAKLQAEKSVNNFYEQNYKPELMKALESEAIRIYKSDLEKLEAEITSLKKQLKSQNN